MSLPYANSATKGCDDYSPDTGDVSDECRVNDHDECTWEDCECDCHDPKNPLNQS